MLIERITPKTYKVLKEMREMKAQQIDGLQSEIEILDKVLARHEGERDNPERTTP